MSQPTTQSSEPRSHAGFSLVPPTPQQFDELVRDLSPEERDVLLDHGTEAPFCGVFNEAKDRGTYVCRLCGLPLFRSGTKFESGTGWPSFFDPIDREHLRFVNDRSYGVVRTEIVAPAARATWATSSMTARRRRASASA